MDIIKSKSSQATVWTVAGFGASSGLRLAGNLVLSRLLIPEDFGTMALIAILMQGLVMFSDVGIGPSIIRSHRGDDPDFLNTAWTIQVVRGLTLWICAGILALPFANFYNQPDYLTFVPVACLNVFIAGFNSTALFTENRALNLGRITAVEIIAQVAGLLVMMSWALMSPTVWALIAGGLVSSVIKAGLSHLLFPSTRNTFRWDRAAASELVKFGKWIFLSTALAFTSAQIDRILLGKLVPLDILGLYSIGYMWAQAPLQLSLAWSSKVFFPVAAKALGTGKNQEVRTLRVYRQKFLLVMAPLIAGLVVAMPKLIDLLYLPTYQLSGLIGSILAAGVWFAVLASTYGAINMAGGKPQYISMAAAAKTIIFIVLVFPFFDYWGVSGVAIAVITSQFGPYLFSAIGAFRLGISNVISDIAISAMAVGYTFFLFWLSSYTESSYNSLILDLVVICGVSCLISVIIFTSTFFRRLILKKPFQD